MTIYIADRPIGAGHPVFIIAEIGINHNGDLALAKQLIDAAKQAGADAVKFQKRTPELCVPRDQWDVSRETPWGTMPYLEYKKRLEFGAEAFAELEHYCRAQGMIWFASCWDLQALAFISEFHPPCYKLASASITDGELVDATFAQGMPVLVSTGMSTWDELDPIVFRYTDSPNQKGSQFWNNKLILMHCRSTYPAALDELNLNMIVNLKTRYGLRALPVGYSGHETGLATTVAAVALGACVIERHITLDRAMWGTDQAASVEPGGFARLVKDIRAVERALGDGVTRDYASEAPIRAKLRGAPIPFPPDTRDEWATVGMLD